MNLTPNVRVRSPSPASLLVMPQANGAGLTYSNCGRQELREVHDAAATAICECHGSSDAQGRLALAEPGQCGLMPQKRVPGSPFH